MGGDCVHVSPRWWWESGGGVVSGDTTQNSHLTCLLCGASRTDLSPSLPLRAWPTSGSHSSLISPI